MYPNFKMRMIIPIRRHIGNTLYMLTSYTNMLLPPKLMEERQSPQRSWGRNSTWQPGRWH